MKYATVLSSLFITAAPLVAQQQDSVSLTPILIYVSDCKSADEAAPRVAKLINQSNGATVKVEPYDLAILRATSCFGSTELQKVMADYLPELSSQAQAETKPFLKLFERMIQAIDDQTATLSGVNDRESARQAAELIEAFLPFMESCSEKINALPLPSDEQTLRELRFRYKIGTRRSAAKLLQAWAALQQRDANFYQSERLLEALLSVRDVLENMDMSIDPDAIPAAMTAAQKLQPIMRQWIAVISHVRDKESADAAAVELKKLQEQMRAVAMEVGLNRTFEEDLFLISPELEVQVYIMDRITHYLQEELNPPYYGATLLKEVLEHED